MEARFIEKVHETNIEEAKHPSVFVAGWRPMIGWIGAIALGYQFVLYPWLLWLWQILQGVGLLDKSISPPPVIESDVLWSIISGMLGIKVDTKKIE